MKTNMILFSMIFTVSLLFGGTLSAQTQQKSRTQQRSNKTSQTSSVKKAQPKNNSNNAQQESISNNAQQKNNNTISRQEIREKAIQTIQKGYELYATCRNVDYQKEFVRLFVNRRAPVYNDLLGLSTKKSLTADEYAYLLGSKVKNTIVTINGISFLDEPYEENGKWKVDIAFNKRVAYFDSCGIYYNSYDFYHADYNLEMILQYDTIDKVCRIERITGDVDSYVELPEKYFVFTLTDERDRNLLYNNNPLQFNSSNQAIIEGDFHATAFSHTNPRVRALNPTINKCNIVTMNYGNKHDESLSNYSFLLKPHFDLGLSGLSIDSNSDLSTSSSSYGFGIDFGLPIIKYGSLKVNAFAGIGFNMSSIDMDYKAANLVSIEVTDLDNDKYKRCYEGLNISQTAKLSELAIPVYFDVEYDLSPGLSIYGDLGARFNFNMSNSIDVNSVEVDKIYGIYSIAKVGTIILDGEWPYEGFTNNHTSLNTTASGDPSGISGTTFDVIGGAGLRYYIPNSPVALDFGVKFQMGMSEMIKQETNSKQTVSSPINYSNQTILNVEEQIREERVNCLTDKLTSVKRNLLALSFGLIFKF